MCWCRQQSFARSLWGRGSIFTALNTQQFFLWNCDLKCAQFKFHIYVMKYHLLLLMLSRRWRLDSEFILKWTNRSIDLWSWHQMLSFRNGRRIFSEDFSRRNLLKKYWLLHQIASVGLQTPCGLLLYVNCVSDFFCSIFVSHPNSDKKASVQKSGAKIAEPNQLHTGSEGILPIFKFYTF